MNNEQFKEIIEVLNELNNDDSTPKSVKIKIKQVHLNLIEEGPVSLKIDRCLQDLDDLNEDVNIPSHIKSQLWDVVSKLECIPQ